MRNGEPFSIWFKRQWAASMRAVERAVRKQKKQRYRIMDQHGREETDEALIETLNLAMQTGRPVIGSRNDKGEVVLEVLTPKGPANER